MTFDDGDDVMTDKGFVIEDLLLLSPFEKTGI